MSSPDDPDVTPLRPPPTSPAPSSGLGRGTLLAVAAGLVVGLVIVFFGVRQDRFAGLSGAEIEIRINAIGPRMGRDVFVPTFGWTLQVELPKGLPKAVRDSLLIEIREERTGAIVEITDRFAFDGNVGSLVVPKELGLIVGLFSVHAALVDEEGQELDAFRRQRVRTWLGGPPIGDRQIIHFDFSVDRDGDGRPDIESDLEALGLVAPESPVLAGAVARSVADHALARVRRAYDRTDDPNHTRAARDVVFVRFQLDAEDSPFVTRICVGGRNAAHPESVGYVRYDPENSLRGNEECQGTAEDGGDAGIFPGALATYRDDPLYMRALGPFLASEGGAPVGTKGGDADLLDAALESERGRALGLAIEVLGDALGTIMAHESAHALGLVAPGKPGLGLFAGDATTDDGYAHNQDVDGGAPPTPWLMNPGRTVRFTDLAGRGEAGELRFRPLNWAYLKDRLILRAR